MSIPFFQYIESSEEDEEDEDEEEKWDREQRESQIDQHTYDISQSCQELLSAAKDAQCACVAVCMGQHAKLGGGTGLRTRSSSRWQSPSPIFSLPASTISLIVQVFLRHCTVSRLPQLGILRDSLYELREVCQYEPIEWDGSYMVPSVQTATGYFVTALVVGLDEGCSKIQSRACYFLYAIGNGMSQSHRLMLRAEQAHGAGERQKMWARYVCLCL